MALAHTAFENRQLVDLAIVAARLFLKQVFAPTFCVEDAGPYKGLGENAPVSGGASMRAAGDAGPYGSESGAVSKFENISKRTDTSTSRAGARSIPLKITGKEQ